MPDPDPHDHGSATAYEQPELSHNIDDGSESISRKYKGGATTIDTLAATFTIGTSTFGGLPLRSKRIERTNANLSILTLEYAKEDQGAGGEDNATELSVTWQIKHTQTNVSIYRYCGQSAGASANRGRIEQWRKGTDAYLYANYQWRDKAGQVLELTARDKLIAGKFLAGKENVMRFYPTLVKTTRLTKGKVADVGQTLLLLGYPADAPASWEGTWEWMQIGDDLTYDVSAGTQTRTETWLGSEGFDTDFYGANRWDFGTI